MIERDNIDLKSKSIFSVFFCFLTLGRTRKFLPPPWYKVGGGGVVSILGIFYMLQYFETILPLEESLWPS